MAWETRNGRGSYYTRSRREGGRVVREYLGGGEAAAAIAHLDALDRERRDRKRAAEQEERERLDEIDRLAGELYAAGERALRAALEAAGYHQHHRGAWRKRRHGTSNGEAAGSADGAGEAAG